MVSAFWNAFTSASTLVVRTNSRVKSSGNGVLIPKELQYTESFMINSDPDVLEIDRTL